MADNKAYRSYNNILNEDFLRVLNLCFNGNWGNKEYYLWKYINKNRYLLKSNIWYSKDDKEITGFFGYIPLKIYIKGVEYSISQAVDSVTHPSHRRKGIFNTLDLCSYSDIVADGCNMVYGVALLEDSTKGHLEKGDWEFWTDTYRKTIKFKSVNIAKNIFLRLNRLLLRLLLYVINAFNSKEYSFEQSKHLPDEHDMKDLYNQFSRNFDVMFNRDYEYMEWRLSKPQSNYLYFTIRKTNELLGLLLVDFNKSDNTYYIEDYAYKNNNIPKVLFQNMVISAIKKNVNKIKIDYNFSFPVKSKFLDLFSSNQRIGAYIIKNNNVGNDVYKLLFSSKKIHFTKLDKNE